MKAEALLRRAVEPTPMTQRFLEQGESPGDISLDELGGTVDRAVDMALSGEIHHVVRSVRLE